MSVKELQERVEEISAEINRQKELLFMSVKKFQERIEEIAGEIIRQEEHLLLIKPLEHSQTPTTPPILFLNICNAWTDIALSTPALWAAIHIAFPRAEDFDGGLGAWLQRTRKDPLTISLHGTVDVAPLLQKHAEQIKSLEIYAEEEDGLALPATLGPFPSLETLTIGILPGVDVKPRFTDSQIIELLRRAPNLVECTFNHLYTYFEGDPPPPNLVLPSLRHLRCRTFEDVDFSTSPIILEHLTLPGLETPPRDILQQGFYTIPEAIIALTSKACPGCHIMGWATQAGQVITALYDRPGFLPDLRSVEIFNLQIYFWMNGYETLFRALSSRRSQMFCFKFIWAPRMEVYLRPRDHEPWIATLQQLVAEGMEIHIGTKDRNFI
ncbi:hypothetical protein DFH09DRAFT_1416839 [Mycena vulgaris]|nr:hypothetical protein DFH09DRAFT_1416839 [Mycena vulgaris]